MKLKYRIMLRVYLAHIKRVLWSPVAIRCYLFVGLAGGLAYHVSFGDVVANMPRNNMFAASEYSWNAFTHTELLVQLLLVAGAGISIALLRDMSRVLPVEVPSRALRFLRGGLRLARIGR